MCMCIEKKYKNIIFTCTHILCISYNTNMFVLYIPFICINNILAMSWREINTISIVFLTESTFYLFSSYKHILFYILFTKEQ